MAHGHRHAAGPSQWLVDNIGLLPVGRTLDVAMGTGRNSVYLARKGFRVEGVDISAEAIATALEAAAEAGMRIKAEVGDLEGGYQIEPDAYDLIICFNYLQRSLFSAIKAGLRPGGVVVYETFIKEQAGLGGPKNPEYLLGHNELLEFFRDFRCLRYREGLVGEDKAVASIVAEKPEN